MKLNAVSSITNNLVAARFWMLLAAFSITLAAVAPYLTISMMKQMEKVVILDPGGTLIYSPLIGFEEAGELHAYHVRLAWVLQAFLETIVSSPQEIPAGVEVQLREEFSELDLPLLGVIDLVKVGDIPVDIKTVASTPNPLQETWQHQLQLITYQLLI